MDDYLLLVLLHTDFNTNWISCLSNVRCSMWCGNPMIKHSTAGKSDDKKSTVQYSTVNRDSTAKHLILHCMSRSNNRSSGHAEEAWSGHTRFEYLQKSRKWICKREKSGAAARVKWSEVKCSCSRLGRVPRAWVWRFRSVRLEAAPSPPWTRRSCLHCDRIGAKLWPSYDLWVMVGAAA